MKLKKHFSTGVLAGAMVWAGLFPWGVASGEAPGAAEVDPALKEPYPLGVCPVSGKALGSMGDAVVFEHEGREVRLCCAPCRPKIEAEPDRYLAEVDRAIIEDQKRYYPEEICLNSRESWGDNPIDRVFYNRLLRFCCPGCASGVIEDIETEGTHLPRLNALILAQQGPTYPLTTCVVSGELLGDAPVEHVAHNRLFRLCGADCVDKLKASPHPYIAALDAARAAP